MPNLDAFTRRLRDAERLRDRIGGLLHGTPGQIGPHERTDLGTIYGSLSAAVCGGDTAELIAAADEARGYLRSAGLA